MYSLRFLENVRHQINETQISRRIVDIEKKYSARLKSVAVPLDWSLNVEYARTQLSTASKHIQKFQGCHYF